jgi:hypothetical protein
MDWRPLLTNLPGSSCLLGNEENPEKSEQDEEDKKEGGLAEL